ncbi:MAG TPA: TetR/AcrR family transcriptional regulator [Solirubrobacteraceae bacterium]|nr:TetR/AcrR family transcriptional regulator [Solirubrobacteraceae bacterium]
MSPRPTMIRVRKAQIRTAAAELIGERGLAATRIEDVAARAGTSKAAVLYWFKDKDALLTEALALQDEVFYAELTQRLASMESAGARLRLVCETFLSSYDYRLWMEICLRSLRDSGTAEARSAQDVRWRAMIAQTILEGQERGEFESGDADELSLSLAALLDGLSMQIAMADPVVSRERATRVWLAAATSWLGTAADLDAAGAENAPAAVAAPLHP